jgi:hypothetical protein
MPTLDDAWLERDCVFKFSRFGRIVDECKNAGIALIPAFFLGIRRRFISFL